MSVPQKCPSCNVALTVELDVYEKTALYPGAVVICYGCHDCLIYIGNDIYRPVTDDEMREWSAAQRTAFTLAKRLIGSDDFGIRG